MTWGVVTLLLGTHLGANLGALGALRLPTLNRPRLRLALGGALRGGVRQGGVRQPHPTGGDDVVVPGPDEINPREPLLPGKDWGGGGGCVTTPRATPARVTPPRATPARGTTPRAAPLRVTPFVLHTPVCVSVSSPPRRVSLLLRHSDITVTSL